MNLNKQYMVWETDGDCGFWVMYDSIVEAIQDKGEDEPIYEMTPKYLGEYEVKSTAIKKRKKK